MRKPKFTLSGRKCHAVTAIAEYEIFLRHSGDPFRTPLSRKKKKSINAGSPSNWGLWEMTAMTITPLG